MPKGMIEPPSDTGMSHFPRNAYAEMQYRHEQEDEASSSHELLVAAQKGRKTGKKRDISDSIPMGGKGPRAAAAWGKEQWGPMGRSRNKGCCCDNNWSCCDNNWSCWLMLSLAGCEPQGLVHALVSHPSPFCMI